MFYSKHIQFGLASTPGLRQNRKERGMKTNQSEQWQPYLRRYESGEWRAKIFRDLVLAEASKMPLPVMLDIGCGTGFDDDLSLQSALARSSREYVGVEPDKSITVGECITSIHHCFFEEAPIPSGSIDLAFSVMVLEHLEDPQRFFDKLRDVLRPGGVFWGFTMDARHWFVAASLLATRLHIKDWYLQQLHGKRGEERYKNYKVIYRTNTPRQMASFTSEFAQHDILNFYSAGQLDFYFPRRLQWIGRMLSRADHLLGMHGCIIALRLQR